VLLGSLGRLIVEPGAIRDYRELLDSRRKIRVQL
jgi:hypothetical protein